MGTPKKHKSLDEQRANLLQMQQKRNKLQTDKRGDSRNYSLEGLRLGSLLSQLQALQAVQGLQELRPKGQTKEARYDFSEDPKERASQRQWLMFKADWLEALLEDTLGTLEALDAYENESQPERDSCEPGAD